VLAHPKPFDESAVMLHEVVLPLEALNIVFNIQKKCNSGEHDPVSNKVPVLLN
jgi:hypothetical protein